MATFETSFGREIKLEKSIMQIAKCRSCGAEIVWMKTIGGKNMPVDAATITDHQKEVGIENTVFTQQYGNISHFATCPNASDHRKAKK